MNDSFVIYRAFHGLVASLTWINLVTGFDFRLGTIFETAQDVSKMKLASKMFKSG
jgi:hypothetical protein